MAVFILLGPEEGEKQELIKREREKIRLSFPDVEEYIFFGGDEDGNGLSSALSQTSLFSSYRFVVLKHFENVKRTDDTWRALEEFGKDSQDDCTLIVTSTETSATSFPKELAAKAGKENTIVFWEMKEDQKRRWIVENVRKMGFQITQDAIDEILSSVDNNTQEMKSLILSITNFLRVSDSPDSSITLETIGAYTSRTKGENGYSLFRALGEGNLEKALLCASSILLNDSREIIPALSVLSSSFRRLEAALEMKRDRKSEDEIFRSVTFVSPFSGGRKNSGINFKEKDLYRKAMRYYSLEDARAIIMLLGRYDKILKSASTEITRITLEKMIYSIVVGKGRETELTLSPPPLAPDYFRS